MDNTQSTSKIAVGLYSILAAFLLLSLAIYGIQNFSLRTIESDALEINLAGAQRMLSQRMTKDALDYNVSGEISSLEALREAVDRFDLVLTGLKYGDEELNLPGTEKSEIREQLDKVERTWRELRPILFSFASQTEAVDANLDKIRSLSRRLLQETDQAVTMFEVHSQAKVVKMRQLQFLLVLVGVFLVCISLFFGRRTVIRPNQQIEAIVNNVYRENQALQSKMREIVQNLAVIAQSSEDATKESNVISQVIHAVSSELQLLNIRSEDLYKETEISLQQMNTTSKEMEQGAATLEESREAAALLERNIEKTGRALHELLEKINQITAFTEEIEGISDQTNLLALNATIEAARAGEQGRGFAVVAEEVRKLAENSALASESVSKLAREMEVAGRATAEVMTSSQQVIREVAEKNHQFGGIFNRIQASGVKAVETIGKIGNYVFEQTTSFEEATASAEQISASAEQTAAGASQSFVALQSLQKKVEEVAKSNEDLVQSIRSQRS